MGLFIFAMLIMVVFRSMGRGGWGRGPWGGEAVVPGVAEVAVRGVEGRGPWGSSGGQGRPGPGARPAAERLGPAGPGYAGPGAGWDGRWRPVPPTRRRPGLGSGGGPAGGGWTSSGGTGDDAIPAGPGRGAGGHLAGVGGAPMPGGDPDWMHDTRPAADSIAGELFPERHARAMQAASPVDVGLAAIQARGL